MRGSQLARAVALGMASATLVAAANDPNYDSSLNFRPDNVTLNGLYHWVGSYYNGSTTIEIKPYDGFTTQEEQADVSSWCPNLKGKTITTKYDTILALTERSKYNDGINPLNAFLTLWDVGYDFSSLNNSVQLRQMPWDWALFSSAPVYSYNGSDTLNTVDTFNFTLAETTRAPYNVSSTFTEYGAINVDQSAYFEFNMTSCNETRVHPWAGPMISSAYWFQSGSNFTYPDPTLDIVFDDKTAKLTLNAHLEAIEGCKMRAGMCSVDGSVVSKMTITFEGSIDSYHSDELETSSAKPTWIKTVGFSDNTQTGGNSTNSTGSDSKKNGASGRQNAAVSSLVAGVFAVLFASLYI